MAVLEKIRVKFGLAASIIIALGLLSFIIDPSELITAFQSMSSKYDVGEINGKKVSYNDFQEAVADMTTINEVTSGRSAQSSEAQSQIRDAAWQDLIYRYLFIKKAKEAGINVGESEMVDLTAGNNLSPLIAQNPAFMDENGNFSKEQLSTLLQNLNTDETGGLKLYWNYLQNSILNQQYYDKYASLFSEGANDSPLMLRKSIEETNNTVDADFIMIPYGYTTDSSIVVSDAEINKYYKDHKKFFKQSASRDMEYVVFEVVPSQADIAAAKEGVANLYEEFKSTDNMKGFLMKNSDRAYTDYWFKDGELTSVAPEVNTFVSENGAGAVSDIISKNNNFYVVKVMETGMVPDSAYVKHILLQDENAAALADSLVGVLKKGENFSSLAAVYSADKNSQDGGELGNIGWLTQNYMIPGFEGVTTAKVGEPYVLNTQYGTHVVLVSKKSAPVAKKRVAILEKEVLASKETFNEYYSKANKFATLASGSYQNYKKAVDTLGVYSHPINNMLESSEKLGAIDNTKEVTRWVFDNKPGKVSNIITVDNNYFFIATVKGVHKEGYATVDEASSRIRQQLYREKLAEKKTAEIAAQIEGMTDLEAIAEKLGGTISSQSGIAFASMNSYGLDPAFIGAVSVAPENKVCGPVAGSVGTYIYKVTGRDTGAFFTEDDAKTRDAQMAVYNAQMIIPVMMQDADVKDNRARFY